MSVKDLEKKIEEISLLLNGGGRKMPQIRRVRVKNDRVKMGHKFTRSWPDRKPAAELTWGISGEDDSRSVEYFSLELRGVQESASKTRKTGMRKAAVGAARFADNVKRNDELNGFTNVKTEQADVFQLLRDKRAEGVKYDLVVLDPPAFCKSANEAKDAYRGYKDINVLGMKLVKMLLNVAMILWEM
jgi:hypothetical protein